MEIGLGKAGLKLTNQDEFPPEVVCVYCGGKASIGFVAHEGPAEQDYKFGFVCEVHRHEPDEEGLWLHDCCSVAVYFCRTCLEPTAKYNQA